MSQSDYTLRMDFEELPVEERASGYSNIAIEFSDGRAYSLVAWTFDYLEKARQEPGLESAEMTGAYVVAPDIFVEKLDYGCIEKAVADIIATGQLSEEWRTEE